MWIHAASSLPYCLPDASAGGLFTASSGELLPPGCRHSRRHFRFVSSPQSMMFQRRRRGASRRYQVQPVNIYQFSRTACCARLNLVPDSSRWAGRIHTPLFADFKTLPCRMTMGGR